MLRKLAMAHFLTPACANCQFWKKLPNDFGCFFKGGLCGCDEYAKVEAWKKQHVKVFVIPLTALEDAYAASLEQGMELVELEHFNASVRASAPVAAYVFVGLKPIVKKARKTTKKGAENATE